MQRGRKSLASTVVQLATTEARPRLTAPAFLTASEASMFNAWAAANPHLTASDAPMLAAFAQAASKTHKAGRQKDISAFERAARLMMALGRTLRLTPQATTHPLTVGHRRNDQGGFGITWQQQLQDDDDDDTEESDQRG